MAFFRMKRKAGCLCSGFQPTAHCGGIQEESRKVGNNDNKKCVKQKMCETCGKQN